MSVSSSSKKLINLNISREYKNFDKLIKKLEYFL